MNVKVGEQGLRSGNLVKSFDERLMELNPQPVTYFTPDNLQEVMEDFLSGKTINPTNATYTALDNLDFSMREEAYRDTLQELLLSPEIPREQHRVYGDFLNNYIKINSLMAAAVRFRKAASQEERQHAKAEFESLNEVLYGKPDLEIASLMAQEVLDDTKNQTDEKLQAIRAEFASMIKEMFPEQTNAEISLGTGHEPNKQVARIVNTIYQPLLKHADEALEQLAQETDTPVDKLKIGPQAIALVFQSIMNEEFPDSGWTVEIKPANAINVVASEKKVVVPENKGIIPPAKLKGLVVHEIGVHVVRSMVGASSNMIPLQLGLQGYMEAEEGIAKVLESAIDDTTARTGYQHYLTASLLGLGYDFRQTFEAMWRYKVLDRKLEKPQLEIDDKFLARQKREAFKFMFRSIRGTNQLPWHMTLNYFNGAKKISNFIETHADDPDLVTLLFMGKSDPTDINHLKSALAAKGRV